jgi:hypothetical protein
MIAKMAPTLITIAFAAWICWPHLSDPAPGIPTSGEGALPRIAPAMLDPAMPPAVDRDPFHSSAADNARTAKTRSDAKRQTISAASQPASMAAVSPEPKPAATPEQVLAEIVHSLVLHATYVRGDKRLALIGDRLYEPGQELQLARELAAPCVVASITADRVVIEHVGHTAEISYRGLAFNAPADGPPARTP